MKTIKLTFFLLIALSQNLISQDYEVRARHLQSGLVAVEARFVGMGAEPQAGSDAFLDFTIDLRWPADANLDFGNPDNTNGYGIAKAGVETLDGTEEYQGYSMPTTPTFLPENWTRDTWIEVFTVQSNSDGSTGETIIVGAIGSNPSNPNIPNFNMSGIDFTPTISGAAVLPVELSYFDVTKKDEMTAQLIWSTSSEQNTSHFNLERSSDFRNWEVIGKVNAAGNSNNILNYEFFDKTIPLAIRQEGTIYYRLNIIDYDEYQEYSDIKAITFDPKSDDLIVFPNPTSALLNIESEMEIISITVFDYLGKEISKINANKVNLEEFSSGIYRLKIETTAGVTIKNVVKLD